MTEEDALQFVIVHLERATHDWWTHGRISLGHKDIKSYEEFSQKLMNRFDDKDIEWYFQELTQLRQNWNSRRLCSQISRVISYGSRPFPKETHSYIYRRIKRLHRALC